MAGVFDKDTAQRNLENLRQASNKLAEACARKTISELELRQMLGVVHQAEQSFEPFWPMLGQEKSRSYQDEILHLNTRALKLVRKINPKILTLQNALDPAISLQERRVTRFQSRQTSRIVERSVAHSWPVFWSERWSNWGHHHRH